MITQLLNGIRVLDPSRVEACAYELDLQSMGLSSLMKTVAKRLNGEVQISVDNTGIGIHPEHLLHIFDRFYCVDKSCSRQSGGGRNQLNEMQQKD